MAPKGHPGCIPTRPNRDQLRSSHCEPPEPPMARNTCFYGISGPFLIPLGAPGGNSVGTKWHQQIILDVFHQDRTKIHCDPVIWSYRSHLWPEMPVLWHFRAISDTPGGPTGQFWRVQMAPTDQPGCIPTRIQPRSLRSSHLEPPIARIA